ncbi:zinc finger CCCH domain-containing protein 14-like [Salvia divinorum]|uniref:Zinc finger CCCH domain-containing protein 14-like n=1 Tax=Salvia divinorum TaxID=28513 RepID=A0ABD1FYI8_SALDI
MDFGRKRGKPDAAFSGNGGFKRSREEMDSFTTGVGSKSKPCTKFFSTAGCSFGDACHFQHYVPGYNAHTQLANMGVKIAAPVGRNTPSFSDSPSPNMKTKLCNRLNTPEGCRYGNKCHFAHSEMELGKPATPGFEDQRMRGGYSQRHEASQHTVGNFGASATAKISIDASFAGPIIGKNGANSKQICRQTGVKLSIKEHETDPNQRNIELEGTFDQIKEASSMVRQLIVNITESSSGHQENHHHSMGGSYGHGGPPSSSSSSSSHYKKKMCEKFPKGLCTFGERCHFAHSAAELRNSLA